jgi:hypothetical protein
MRGLATSLITFLGFIIAFIWCGFALAGGWMS